jgi:ribose transport system substrate-binding protein
MDRRSFVLGGAGLIGAAVSGCHRNEDESQSGQPSSPGRRHLTFAIVPKMLNNPVFTLAQRGAQRAAKQLGAIEVIYQGSPTGVAAEQVDVIRQMVQRRVNGISISVTDANAVREAINEAARQGIPVICFDSDCPNSDRRTFTAVNNRAVGHELVVRLIEACGGQENMDGEIAILSGQASAPNLQERVDSAKEELVKYPRARLLPTLFCDDNPDKAIEQIRVTMEAHQDLRGWVMVGGWALFRPNALDPIRSFKRTRVVSMDALPEEVDCVARDQVYCLVAQRCFAWGEQSVQILYRLINRPDYHPESFIDAGYDLVFKDPTPDQRKAAEQGNVKVYSADQYRQQWAAWNSEG